MKKLIFAVAISIIAVSCSTYTYTPAPTVPTPKSKHTVTADYRSVEIKSLVTAPIVADLKVSSKKISYAYTPTKDVIAAGLENVIKMAVTEALYNKGDNGDVLIGMQHQVKYNNAGEISLVIVSGYPAHYVDFRHPSESIWLNENTFIKSVATPAKK